MHLVGGGCTRVWHWLLPYTVYTFMHLFGVSAPASDFDCWSTQCVLHALCYWNALRIWYYDGHMEWPICNAPCSNLMSICYALACYAPICNAPCSNVTHLPPPVPKMPGITPKTDPNVKNCQNQKQLFWAPRIVAALWFTIFVIVIVIDSDESVTLPTKL